MEYNLKGIYDPTESYIVKDVVPFAVNGITQYYFCLQANSPDSPQSPSPNGDTAYWGLINALSNFPNSIDTFITKSPIQYNDIPYLQRYQELKLKRILTTEEQVELDEIFQAIRSKLIIPEDFNALQQSITNMQMFFHSEIVAYLNSIKADLAQTVEDAIQDVEDKRLSMINYLETTEVGALKNDVGDLNLLQTRAKDNLVNALNEVKNDQPDATTTKKGLVKLNDTVTSTSVTEASTANAIRKVNELASSKYTKPTDGIPKSDLDVSTQISLNKADSALQSFPSASTTTRGAVILSSSVTSTSTLTAANSYAVKQVYDLTSANLYPPGGNVGDVLLKTSNGVEWVNPILLQSARYLYNRGVSYINFTPTSGAIGTFTNNSSLDYIENYTGGNSGCSFHSTTPIDLTPYSAIRFTFSGRGGNSYTNVSIGVANSVTHSSTIGMVKIYSSNIISTNQSSGSITVADLSGSYYLRFFIIPGDSDSSAGLRLYELELLR